MKIRTTKLTLFMLFVSSLLLAGQAFAADSIKGQVLGGGAPIAQSSVTLWEASAGPPKQLGQTKTDNEGRFEVRTTGSQAGASLYLVATGGEPGGRGGDNPAIALLTVVGSKPPTRVVIDEMTTLASVVTHTQFIDGAAIKGSPLELRIAAGNVPNFVNLEYGSYGETILDPLNSAQTPTMANFATLSSIVAGCVTRVRADACSSLFYVGTSPTGAYPKDTLAAVESIVRYPSHQADKVFGLLNYFYPLPNQPGKIFRPTPFMPYLTYSPSAWIFPLKFTGGGYSGGGKMMFDSEGNAWVGDNFIVGAQNADALWDGNLTKFAPNGKGLSPSPLGFTGGGVGGIGFGLAIDSHDNVWGTTYGTKAIAKFDKNGKPLSPPDGYNFGHQLGQMQGIIVTPNGDVWTIDIEHAQVIHMPQGDPAKAKFFCQNKTGDPLKNPCKLLAPFHLAIDQQDRIWISNVLSDNVTRFPASDPSKLEFFKAGWSGSGIAIDSMGNVWVCNRSGSSERGHAKILEAMAAVKVGGEHDFAKVLVDMWATQRPGYESGGSITVFRPDGTQASFSPVSGEGIVSPWAISVDGNDNMWISNLATASAGIVQLCGFRTERCPPGVKTGEAISPSVGYVGGGMQMLVDIGIGPAGDVWVTNNWQYYPADLGQVDEALSTLGAGQGVTVFFGMGAPTKAPLIGPPRQR